MPKSLKILKGPIICQNNKQKRQTVNSHFRTPWCPNPGTHKVRAITSVSEQGGFPLHHLSGAAGLGPTPKDAHGYVPLLRKSHLLSHL